MIRYFNIVMFWILMSYAGIAWRDVYGVSKLQMVIAFILLWAYYWSFMDKKVKDGN